MRKPWLCAAMVVALLGVSPAHGQGVVLHTLEHALVVAFANEWALVQKGTSEAGQPATPTWNDPVKLRLGAFAPTNYYGAISGDRLVGDKDWPRRYEKTLIAFKEDAEFSGEARRPMIQLQIQRGADTFEDKDMVKALSLTAGYALFHVPLYAPNIGAGAGPPSHLTAGAYEMHLQATDGNFVVYERVGEAMCPRWAANWLMANGTGVVARAALSPPCDAPSLGSVYP